MTSAASEGNSILCFAGWPILKSNDMTRDCEDDACKLFGKLFYLLRSCFRLYCDYEVLRGIEILCHAVSIEKDKAAKKNPICVGEEYTAFLFPALFGIP